MTKRSEDPRAFKMEIVSIASLKPHPRNYVSHPKDQIAHISESIREHGIYRNIIIARDGTILAGHGVVEAAKGLGIESIPVRRLDLDPLDPRALKVVVGDNEIEHLGEIGDRALSDLLREIAEQDEVGLLGTGYDAAMLANLVFVTRPEKEIPDIVAAQEWAAIGMPEFPEGSDAIKLVVLFKSKNIRAEFLDAIGIEKPDSVCRTTMTIWWPRKSDEPEECIE